MYSDSIEQAYHRAIREGKGFVAWRIPDQDDVQLIAEARVKVWDGTPDSGFLFAPFNTERHPILCFSSTGQDASPISELPLNLSSTGKDHYTHLVSHSISAIQQGTFHKIVGARVARIDEPVAHVPALFNRILSEHSSAFCYLLYHPSLGTWTGATPELLVKADDQGIQTMALAGTQERGKNSWGDKEIEEQSIVLEYIREILLHFGDDLVVKERIKHASGHLEHWMNGIELKQSGLMPYLNRILDQLHPTPAVAGIPKRDAVKFIEGHEDFERSYYSGYLGPITANSADLFVNLRCLHADDQAYELFAGAGLTTDSDPEKEWKETEEKLKVIGSLI